METGNETTVRVETGIEAVVLATELGLGMRLMIKEFICFYRASSAKTRPT